MPPDFESLVAGQTLRANHSTKSVCDADVDCEWDYGGDYCNAKLCRYTDIDQRLDDSKCRWEYSDASGTSSFRRDACWPQNERFDFDFASR